MNVFNLHQFCFDHVQNSIRGFDSIGLYLIESVSDVISSRLPPAWDVHWCPARLKYGLTYFLKYRYPDFGVTDYR